jgi:hypothetical protein
MGFDGFMCIQVPFDVAGMIIVHFQVKIAGHLPNAAVKARRAAYKAALLEPFP